MDTRIKERLTGALILVAALVILVPEIFSGRRLAKPANEAPPAAPATEGPPLRTYTSELAASSPPAPGAAAPPVETPSPAPAQSPAPPPPPPAREAAPAPKPTPPPAAPPHVEAKASPTHTDKPAPPRVADKPAAPSAKPPPVAAGAGEWFVQVGSFSQAANADRYVQQLRQQGFTASALPPPGGKGLIRVRVGPAHSKEAAAALLDKLAAAGHKGAVVGP